jgi:lysine 2,3-aminomutase
MIFQMRVKKELWRSYHWQIQNRVKTQEELERFLRLLPEEIEGIRKNAGNISYGYNSLLSFFD